MMPSPQGGPLSARLGARLGPEAVASILVLAVLFVVVAVAMTGQRGSAPPASSAPSVAAVEPSASASPSSAPVTASPSVPATATPPATVPPPSTTPAPEQAAAARAVLENVDGLLGERSGLQAELAKSSTDSKAIADLLRQVNASIVKQDGPLADLAAYPSTADLARRIRAVNMATSDIVNRIQHTSPRNAKTYRDGAAEVVKSLETLPALRAELAQLTG